ncbi:MAG: hypothetical protein HY300_08515 [Verrucomicrobia bacterium]|nr:hypothetical protein [Verrucomicrobiota bacterium]
MKTKRLMFISALSGLVAFAPAAFSQEKKDEPKAPERGKAAPGDRLKELAEQLNLTDEQKEKLKPIVQEEVEKLKALREDATLSRQDKVAKFREIQEGAQAKIKAILTPEQQEKMDKLREKAKENFKKRKEKQQ